MADDIYRNKKDFARQEFSTEVTLPLRTTVSPREAKSQKAQYDSGGGPGFRKDVKLNISHKETHRDALGQVHHDKPRHIDK